MTKSQFLFLTYIMTFMCLYTKSIAQINFTSQVTNSTCSANGEIQIAVSGNGTMPYNFLLNGVPIGTANAPSYNYQGLAPGTYQVKVVDSSIPQKMTQQSIVVGGTYIEPELTCAVNGCEIVATVSNGLAPFEYAIATTSANGPFSAYQSSNIFTNIPLAQVCYIRVKDACDNIYTQSVQLGLNTLSMSAVCTPISTTAYSVLVGTISGGAAPYTVSCTGSNGTQTLSAPPYGFTPVEGCDYTILVEDVCGRSQSWTLRSCIVPSMSVTCIDCSTGSLQLTASGGTPPYQYEVYAGTAQPPYATNTTGSFTGLVAPTNGKNYIVRVEDACGNYTSLQDVYCPKLATDCVGGSAFDGHISIDINSDYLAYNPFFPINIIGVTSAAVPNNIVINNASQLPVTLDGFLSGMQQVKMVNSCGGSATVGSDCKTEYEITMVCAAGTQGTPGSGQCSGTCGNSLSVSCLTPGCSFQVYLVNPYMPYTTNTSGFFPFIPVGTYEVTIISPTGYPLVRDTFNTRLFFENTLVECRKIEVGACPSGLVFNLYSLTGTLLVANNTNGIFPNLQPGTTYKVTATDPTTNETVHTWLNTSALGTLVYDIIDCVNLEALLEPIPNVLQSAGTPLFTLTGNNGYNGQNMTGVFPNLPDGNYTLEVSVNGCDTLSKTFSIGLPYSPTFCIYPLTVMNPNSNAYEIGWGVSTYQVDQLLFSDYPNVNIPVLANTTGNEFSYNGLYADSSYHFFSPNCEKYGFTLPPIPPANLQATITSTCLNLACIELSGAMKSQDWYNWATANGFSGCSYQYDNYVIMTYPNMQLITNTSNAEVCDIPVGGNLVIYLQRMGLYVDTVYLYIPPYQQINLSGLGGYTCAGTPLGNISLTTAGSGYPFTFELLNPPVGYSPTSISTVGTSNSVNFGNLPNGLYQFMVYDACGASSDFSAAIQPFEFYPEFDHTCDGNIILSVSPLAGVSYAWTNANGGIVGVGASSSVPYIGAQTYTITAQGGICSYTTTINVPYVNNNILPNAGNDANYPFSVGAGSVIFSLSGSSALANASSQWQLISPVGSPVNIFNPNNAQTNVEVTATGTYQFMYIVQGEVCADTDTVSIVIYNCSGYESLKFEVEIEPETCQDEGKDGAAAVKITGGTGPFTYLWNTGETTSTIQNLKNGTYSVKVKDTQGCYLLLDEQQKSVTVPYISPKVNAHFSSTPDNTLPIMQTLATLSFTNRSKNANTYFWTFGNEGTSSLEHPTVSLTNIGETTVTLLAKNQYCEDSYQIKYQILENGTLWIPTAFSPNDDGANDVFYVQGAGVVTAEVRIFSPIGTCVYYSTDLLQGWGGRYQGKDCPEGVYTVMIDATLKNGTKTQKASTITLIR
ncbi:MAG: gliding motility-associated C-terminal domain-containing protein [Bacteroidia bacterium]